MGCVADDVRFALHAYRWATRGEVLVVTRSVADALRKMGVDDGYVELDMIPKT